MSRSKPLFLFRTPEENLSRLGPHLRTHHALIFHVLDHASGAVITNLQPSLHVGNRCVPCFRDNRDRLVKHFVDIFIDSSIIYLFHAYHSGEMPKWFMTF